MHPEDAIVYSNTVMEHLANVQKVLELLQTVKGTLVLVSCIFFDTAVFILGHTIHPGQLEDDKRNLVAIEWATARIYQTEP